MSSVTFELAGLGIDLRSDLGANAGGNRAAPVVTGAIHPSSRFAICQLISDPRESGTMDQANPTGVRPFGNAEMGAERVRGRREF